MSMPRRSPASLVAVLVLWLGVPESAHAQDPAPALSAAEMEAFLLDAELTDVRDAGAGVTGSQRATASDGRLTHDVHIQSVDISRSRFVARGARVELNFRDSYLYNVAAYRLAVLLGIDNVPMSVLRRVDGRPAAVTWWVDDVAMTEAERIEQRTLGPDPARTSRQFYIQYVFDELIQNRDRNQGNMLWTTDWKMWLIDHTRAFRQDVELTKHRAAHAHRAGAARQPARPDRGGRRSGARRRSQPGRAVERDAAARPPAAALRRPHRPLRRARGGRGSGARAVAARSDTQRCTEDARCSPSTDPRRRPPLPLTGVCASAASRARSPSWHCSPPAAPAAAAAAQPDSRRVVAVGDIHGAGDGLQRDPAGDRPHRPRTPVERRDRDPGADRRHHRPGPPACARSWTS